MTSDASKGVGIFVPAMSTFDNFANSYDDALAQGLNVTGESREYFARGRIDFLKGCLDELAFHPESAIDFGCGTGANLPLLQKIAIHVMGLDESEKSVAIAESYATTRRPSEFLPSGGVDLVFCNGVFHHIRPPKRPEVIRYIRDCLRPDGIFALWDNNPYNPGTRLVAKRIAFETDSVMIGAREARRLLRAAGFRILSTRYLFIFPRALRALRGLERPLSQWPLGGQYQVLAVKEGNH
jgi:SAM-dependent methyltransferase